MGKLDRQRTLVFALIALLVYGLSCFGLLPVLAHPEARLFNFGSVTGLPLDSQTAPLNLPQWQNGRGYGSPATPTSAQVSFTRLTTKHSRHAHATPFACTHNLLAANKEICLHIIESARTPLLVHIPISQYLDIPPPAL